MYYHFGHELFCKLKRFIFNSAAKKLAKDQSSINAEKRLINNTFSRKKNLLFSVDGLG